MAYLADSDLVLARCRYVAATMAGAEDTQVTKDDLKAAAQALDHFLDDNAATINAAIPQPARAALTPRQKARLLVAVIERRYEVS